MSNSKPKVEGESVSGIWKHNINGKYVNVVCISVRGEEKLVIFKMADGIDNEITHLPTDIFFNKFTKIYLNRWGENKQEEDV